MKSISMALALAALAVGTIVGSTNAAGLAKSGSMERVVTTKNVGASAVESEKFSWSGDRLRNEKYTVGGVLVQIKNGRTLYMYDPVGKEAIKTTLPDQLAKSVEQMLMEQAGPVTGGKKVGAAKIAGIDCDVYMMSKVEGGRRKSAKVYVSKDPRLPIPLKIEITMGKGSQIVETRNVRLNVSVPDSMFSVPKGTKITVKALPPPSTKIVPGAGSPK